MPQPVKESGHWYAADGEPAYTQPNKSKPGETRPTTIRDARKLNLVPSVTGILKMAAQPGLERWKLQQLMLAALTMPAIEGESITEYENRLWEDANSHAKEAREKGTEIHGYVESNFEDCNNHADNPYVVAVRQCLDDTFGSQVWSPEKSFASKLGFGGKVDLFSPMIIVDHKTKDFTAADVGKKPFTYDENKMQLAAYRKGLVEQGLCRPGAVMANLYIARELQEDGTALVKLEIHDDDYWPHFECLLNYWKLVKGVK